MEVLNPTIPSRPHFFSAISFFSPKYSATFWRKKNPSRLIKTNSGRRLHRLFSTYLPPSTTKSFRISAHFGRTKNRRNSLRKKFTEQQQQVRHSPIVHDPSSNFQTPGHDYDNLLESKVNSDSGAIEDFVNPDSGAIEVFDHIDNAKALKSNPLGESVLWNKLEGWVDQYKNDSEFWGIGFSPIFTVYQDSLGNFKRVVVDENEILRRSGIEPRLYKANKLEDSTELSSKISHANFLAREIERGNYVFPKNSSVTKFVVAGREQGFVNAIRGLTIPPSLCMKLPRLGIMLLCGFFVIWVMKTLFTGGKDKAKYTRLQKEIMRRKMKARKEKAKLIKGGVEVIQDPVVPELASSEKPKLNQQELINNIKKAKVSSSRLVLQETSSSLPTKSKDFEGKIQEIRAMARHAREIERRVPSSGDSDRGDDLILNELFNQKEEVKKQAEDVPLPNDLPNEFSGLAEIGNGTLLQSSVSDMQVSDIGFGDETLMENGHARASGASSMEVSGDNESIIPNVIEKQNSAKMSNTIEACSNMKSKDCRSGEVISVENTDVQGYIASSMKVSTDNESTINGESGVNIADTVKVSQSTDTLKSQASKQKKTIRTKRRVICSVEEAKDFLSQKRDKQEPNEELKATNVPENAVISNFERGKESEASAMLRFHKDKLSTSSVNDFNDTVQKRTESVATERNDPEAASIGSRVTGIQMPKALVYEANVSVEETGPSVLASPRERETNNKISKGMDKDKKVFQPTNSGETSDSSSVGSAVSDSTSKIVKDSDPENFEEGNPVNDLQKPLTSVIYKNKSRITEKISPANKDNWMEKNFHILEPVVKKIGGGFRDNYMVAREKVKQELDLSFETMQPKFDENDGELDWMKDDRLREIVFQVRENELAGHDPFYLMDEEDKLVFFEGLERKVEKENEKLLNLHEWLHSNIENLDYGADGISLYDPPEKVIPRWKGPQVGENPDFLNNFVEQRERFARNLSNSYTTRKGVQNSWQKSKESTLNENNLPSSEFKNQNTDILGAVRKSPKTVIEGSDGSVKAGKKSGKEYWQHTKKWSRGFLESYSTETDPETRAIMKDIGKDLDRWITEKEIQEAADLMNKIPVKGRQFVEKKLNKVKREMELFGPQAVVSKYREYAEEKEEDYLWWLDLPFVLCIELYTNEDGEDKVGLYSLEMAADLELDPKQYHVIAFEDPGDCKNLCYIIQAHMEMLGNGNAFVVARPPKDAFREAKANGFSVTVIRKGELLLNVDQTLEEVEEQITEIGSKIYHDRIMREQSVDISALMKGVFGASKPTKRRRSRRKLKKRTK